MKIGYCESASSNSYDKFVVGTIETKEQEIPDGMHELSDEELQVLIDHMAQLEKKPLESMKGVSWRISLADENLGYVATQVVFGCPFSTILEAMKKSKEENGVKGIRIYGQIGGDIDFNQLKGWFDGTTAN